MSEFAAPFPYFGGKRRAAPLVWRALGDPGGYVEPFAGSLAVLLARPAFAGRRVETVNDADGWLVNAWRAIQHDPGAVAEHAFWPVSEIDYHARLAWLQARRGDDLVSWLEGDPEAYDAQAAGWWLYVMACGIGDPFGGGPWLVRDDRLVDSRTSGTPGEGCNRKLPHLGDAGRGVLAAYLQRLSDRLTRVRITCGDWRRVVQPSVYRATAGSSDRAIFLDPPYATSGDLYAAGDSTVAAGVRDWCAEMTGSDLRIVLCGYDDEHADLEPLGWTRRNGRSGRGAGYSVRSDNGRRERLWLSPACLALHEQSTLDFTDGAA